MPHIPTMSPGMLVQWWTDGSAEPVARLFTGEHGAREAKRFVVGLMEKTSSAIRVMAVIDVFQCTGGTQRLVPDQWAPCLDLMMREQALGRGYQVQRRGPPKTHPVEFMKHVQSAMEADGTLTDSGMGYTHPPSASAIPDLAITRMQVQRGATASLFPEEPPGPPQAPRNRGGES